MSLPELSIQNLVSLLSPTKQVIQIQWPPSQVLTPGTKVHHLTHDRLKAYLCESTYREYRGARSAARGYKQTWSAEPVHGLNLSFHCPRGLQQKAKLPLLAKELGMTDCNLDIAAVCASVIAYLLCIEQPILRELPIFITAYQNYKLGYAPQQIRQLPQRPDIAPYVLDYLHKYFRYDLSDPTLEHFQYTASHLPGNALCAAQAFRPANSTVHPPVQAGARAASPLFDEGL